MKTKTTSEILAEGTLIERAMRRAVREAIEQHRRAGNPIAVWRNGKVAWITPPAPRRRTQSRGRSIRRTPKPSH